MKNAYLLLLCCLIYTVGLNAQTPKPIRIEPQPNQGLRLSWPSRPAAQLIYQISLSKDGKEVWKKQTTDTTLLFTEANKVLQSAQVYQLSVTALDVLTGKQEVVVANQNWQAPAQCTTPTGTSLQGDGPAALLLNWEKKDAYPAGTSLQTCTSIITSLTCIPSKTQ